MTATARTPVRNRLVVHIYGYQPTGPERFHHRFARDLATFGTTWSVATETGPATITQDQARWSAQVGGPGWQTRSDYRIVRLDDLIAVKHGQPLLARLAQGYLGLFDFIFDRALVGYFRLRWPYALFTLFPLVATLLTIAAAVLAGLLLAQLAGTLLGLAGGLLAFAGAFAVVGRRYHVLALLEDWAFASILVRRLEPEIERRLDAARRDLEVALSEESCDEILLIGHSLGAVLVLHLAEKLLKSGALRKNSKPVGILTIGSSLLKIGLHGKARGIRAATQAVTSSPALVWADYQSRLDIMNFYGSDPAAAMGLPAVHPPIVRKATFSRMIEPEAYRRLKFDFFRTHNQFVHAATRRSVYDYFLFACGPFLFADLATTLDGALSRIDGDGALTAFSGESAMSQER